MTEAQIQLQNALTTTFLANLAFLSEYDNELYHRVDELSRMIENGTYKEKYALEFIMESGDFDIYDIVNDKYLYNKNPKKFNNELVSKVQFDEKNSIFNLEEVFFNSKENLEIKNRNKYNLQHIEEFYTLVQNDMLEYTSFLGKISEKKKLKKINKFIFFGTLLGRHVPEIVKKINADIYLICEKNLEIFRLSLFVVDYTILVKNKGAIFSIMDDVLLEEKKILDFLYSDFMDNYLLKFSTTNINIGNYVDIMLSNLIALKPSIYEYNRRLYSYVNRSTKIIQNSYNVLQMKKISNEFNFLKDVSILYLAAGPSLEENLVWIKENHTKFFVVTIGAAYKKLIDNNIHIDMITTLDEQELLDTMQFDNESVSKISKNTIILASSITNEKILKKFHSKNLFIFEVNYPFYEENIGLKGFSIGEVTVDILIKMNPKQIYTLGLDLALNQKTGQTHFSESKSGVHTYDLSVKQNRDNFHLRESFIKVRGNMKNDVFTTVVFYSSIKYLEKIIKDNFYKEVIIYNLSSSGAYFEGTIPKNIMQIDINNIVYEKITFQEKLKAYSLNVLSDNSKMVLINEISFLKVFTKNHLKRFESETYEIYEYFYTDLMKLMNLIINNNQDKLAWILDNYISFVLPYLNYYFNDKTIKNESKKINGIKSIFTKQVRILIDDYIKCIENLI